MPFSSVMLSMPSGEQLVAASMYAGKDRDRCPEIDRLDVIDDEGDGEIHPPIRERLRKFMSRGLDIGDFREALGTQQLLGGKLRRGGADKGALEEAHGGRFEPPFSSKHPRRAKQPERTGR